MIKIVSKSPQETIRLGSKLGRLLSHGECFVALIGCLGAGKTYFTKGIAEGLGVAKKEHIVSPTFVLGNFYRGKKLSLFHFDAYRLENAAELLSLGLKEALTSTTLGVRGNKVVTVLEWADKILHVVRNIFQDNRAGTPDRFIDRIIKVKMTVAGNTKRIFRFVFPSEELEKQFRCLVDKESFIC